MDAKLKMNDVLGAMALVMVVSLSACSSKPSPWSQQSSPWSKDQVEEVPLVEDTPPTLYPETVEPIEPAGLAAMEEMPAEPEALVVVEPEPEPVMAGDIVSQPAGYFAVQVCASSSMDKLLKFAERHQLPDQWTAKVNVRGKDWYVLLLGIYPTREEASAALSDVRGQLDTRPWIRSVGSLQAVMVP